MKSLRGWWCASLLGLALLTTAAVSAQTGAPANGEWPTYSGDLAGSKYSPLDQIDAGNFGALEVAWRWRSADAVLSLETPGGGEWRADSRLIFDELNRRDPNLWRDALPPTITNFKATPLMVGGRLFVKHAHLGRRCDRRAYRRDALGLQPEELRGRHHHDERALEPARRGVLVRRTRTPGGADLLGHRQRLPGLRRRADRRPVRRLRGARPRRPDEGHPARHARERDWLNALLYSVQSPPIVVGDTVVTPMSISSLNDTRERPPGWMRGFDARTGATNWTFHTIPQGDEFGNDTWEGDSWRHTGKVGVWTMMSADPELGYIYLPLNTAAPDYYGGHRPGANLFAESLLALDLETGERVWHFQFVHHGLWDYDLPAAPNLVDIVVDGRPVKAVAQITKQGFVFMFDRVTGEPIWPIEERPVNTETDLEGEAPWPTQPFPTRPAPFEYQGVTIDDLADFTPEIREMAIAAVEPFRIGPLYTPQSLRGTVFRPSTGGGANWGGAGFDPETGLLYVPSRNAFAVKQYRVPEPNEGATLRYIEVRGAGSSRPEMPQGLPLFKPPYSRMTAIDLDTGDHVWMTPTGNGDRIRNHPLLRHLDLPPVGGDSGRSGPLVTRTLLIYALTTGGSNDGPRLVAYDKATGAEIGWTDLPGGAIGTPMTYMLDGRQHIALTVGGGRVPELIALALPE